jgi:hypothetical protein
VDSPLPRPVALRIVPVSAVAARTRGFGFSLVAGERDLAALLSLLSLSRSSSSSSFVVAGDRDTLLTLGIPDSDMRRAAIVSKPPPPPPSLLSLSEPLLTLRRRADDAAAASSFAAFKARCTSASF